jgi:hypothetical protein
MSMDPADASASSLACFSATYAAARAKLRVAASEAGAVISTHVHPRLTGPDGGDLSVDVAAFGPANAALTAGAVRHTRHRGRTGSAAPLVRAQWCPRPPARRHERDPVHAINP